MTIDNVAAITLQPYFASVSDRTDSRFGRRMPFLLIGMPITALFFVIIPRASSLFLILLATLAMNVGIAIFNSPTFALMPDITPSKERSKANGIINFMGGLGALLAFFVGSQLYKMRRTLPFDVTSVLLIAALVVVFLFIRERRYSMQYVGVAEHGHSAAGEEVGVGDIGRLLKAVRELVRSKDRSALYLLLGCLSWVAAVNGAQNMFTRYGVHYLGIKVEESSFILGFFALTFIVFAIPAGYLAGRIGRMTTIKLGISGTLLAFLLLQFVASSGCAPYFFLLAGLSWALIITNAYPTLMDLTPLEMSGTYTGLWNMTIAIAGLAAPPVYGWIVDLFGYGFFFTTGIGFLVLALVLVQRVRFSL